MRACVNKKSLFFCLQSLSILPKKSLIAWTAQAGWARISHHDPFFFDAFLCHAKKKKKWKKCFCVRPLRD